MELLSRPWFIIFLNILLLRINGWAAALELKPKVEKVRGNPYVYIGTARDCDCKTLYETVSVVEVISDITEADNPQMSYSYQYKSPWGSWTEAESNDVSLCTNPTNDLKGSMLSVAQKLLGFDSGCPIPKGEKTPHTDRLLNYDDFNTPDEAACKSAWFRMIFSIANRTVLKVESYHDDYLSCMVDYPY